MKANRRVFPRHFRPHAAIRHAAAIGLALLPLALVAGCSEKRVVPTPSPSPTPRPAPPPPQPAPTTKDWRQAPQTPGDWTWSREGAQTVARFAGGRLVLRCDRGAGTVSIEQPATAAVPVPVTILTSSIRRTLTANPAAGGQPVLVTALAPSDPLLDAMAFSRGRFAVETPGLAPLYVPSWTEVGRVIEDCR